MAGKWVGHLDGRRCEIKVGDRFESRVKHSAYGVGVIEVVAVNADEERVTYTSSHFPGRHFQEPAVACAVMIGRGDDAFLGSAWKRVS